MDLASASQGIRDLDDAEHLAAWLSNEDRDSFKESEEFRSSLSPLLVTYLNRNPSHLLFNVA